MSRSITFHSDAVGIVSSPVSRQARNGLSDGDDGAAGSDALREQLAAEAEALIRVTVEEARRHQAGKCRQCGAGFDTFLQKMKQEIAGEVVEMSVKLAEIIVRHHLPDPVMVKDVIRQTLEPISDLHGARVRLHPTDAEGMKSGCGASPMFLSDSVEIVSDSSLNIGDLVIESRNGIFDARLTERLSLLRESLANRRGKSHANNR